MNYYRGVLLGGIVGFVIAVLIYMLGIAVDTKDSTQVPAYTKVVGNYKECEIVEYTNPMQGRYHYFLYCGEQK